MTNFSSIMGGALWMLVSVLLVSLALEPVSVKPRAEMAQAASTARAA